MAGKVSEDEGGDMCEINVTPLVDVVLVLLIVFMITVPAIVGSAPVDVNLPGTSAIASAMENPESLPFKLFVNKNETGETRVTLGDHNVALAELSDFLRSFGGIDKSAPVQIAADQGLPYREVVEVMDCLSAVGISKLSLETKHVEK